MSSGVAPDGSPVDVYRALPSGETPRLIDAVLPRSSSVLELGSGPGRITHPLIESGHRLVAVDNAPEMLAHIRGAETVLADIYQVDLAARFDAVIAGSHLINAARAARRRALLDVCHRHVTADGSVLVERYDPEWAAAPVAGTARLGPVTVAFEPLDIRPSSFRGRVTYTLHGRAWSQEFEAAAVTDAMLEAEAGAAGLEVSRWLDAARTWAHLRRTS